MSEYIIRAAETDAPVVFDYSGLDKETAEELQLAEQMFSAGRRMAETGLRRMADAVALAHAVLCETVVHHVDNGQFATKEDTFRAWCDSVGVGKTTAYKMLQVSTMFNSSSPSEQKVLEELSPSLLYAAAKPSAPAELVQAVKDGGIDSHKQYQELLAKYKAERERALDEVKAARVAQAEAMAEARRIRSDLELADRKAEGYKRQVAELDQEASQMQDAIDDLRIENEGLKAAMSAAPVAPAVVDQDEVDRRVREGVAAALADEEAKWAEAAEVQQRTIRRLKETAGLAGQIKAAGEAVTAVLESLLARLDPAELDGPAVRALDGLSDTLERYAGRLYDATEGDDPDDELEED